MQAEPEPVAASGQAHHPRLFGLEAEEHHLVTGPKRKEAAQVCVWVISDDDSSQFRMLSLQRMSENHDLHNLLPQIQCWLLGCVSKIWLVI